MKVNIANPLYDVIFKYLVEDERIAQTLLSALLRKKVVEVEMRAHEYSNITRDQISMFRIDFGAKVREEDGNIRLVLVELQKTWVETETLRFRQYLGAHYSNPNNMEEEKRGKKSKYDMPEADSDMVGEKKTVSYGIPMVTIYLLGHKVGDIEEPVIYASHDICDYDGNPVTKGLPDPFVESLIHDSIIVQIPRLRGRLNNRLEKLLSLFDQTKQERHTQQMLTIEDDKYEDDPEIQRIVHRLMAAASNHELRMEMNVEDEFFKAIEDRDTAIMERETKLKEKDTQLKEKDTQIKEKDRRIDEQDKQIVLKDEQLSQKDQLILQQRAMLRSIVQSMIGQGMTIDVVAKAMNQSPDYIRTLLE